VQKFALMIADDDYASLHFSVKRENMEVINLQGPLGNTKFRIINNRDTQTHREGHNHTQMPHRRSPSPTHTLSICCCQIKAWKAGHKGECTPAARADTRTAAKLTADQMCVSRY